MKTHWYKIQALAKDEAIIDIFDLIGEEGISAENFIHDLDKLGAVKKIRVRINSYGGSFFEGIAIHNALKRHPATIATEIIGIAASAASLVAMAGRLVMASNSWLFIHNAEAGAIGNWHTMKKMTDELIKFDNMMVAIYAKKSGRRETEAREWIDNETWFDGTQAKKSGLCDEVTDAADYAVAAARMVNFKNMPRALARRVSAVGPPHKPFIEGEEGIRQIAHITTAAGVAHLALGFINQGFTVAEVKDRLRDAPVIRKMCADAGVADRWEKYIVDGWSLTRVDKDLEPIRKLKLEHETFLAQCAAIRNAPSGRA